MSAWQGWNAVAEEYRELDSERVLVLTTSTGRGKSSGLGVGQLYTHGANLFDLRGRRVTRLVTYWNRDRAFADLGLSESAVLRESVDVVRRAVEAMTRAQARRSRDGSFRERDLAEALAVLGPDHELVPYMTRIEGMSFRGAVGYRRWIEWLDDAWESYEVRPEELTEIDDDRVLVAYRFRARSRLQGIPIDEQLAWVMTVRDGKLARTEAYASVSEALKAVGPQE